MTPTLGRHTKFRATSLTVVGGSVVVAMMAFLFVAGVLRQDRSGAAGAIVPSAPPVQVNWAGPLPDEIQAATVSAADTDLAFPLKMPTAIGSSPSIFVSNPVDYPQEVREAALVFSTSSFGSFDILERVSDQTQSELESLTEHNSDGGSTKFTLVTLDDGTEAVLETGNTATSVEWLDGPAEIVVVGPAATFTPDQAMAVANATTPKPAARLSSPSSQSQSQKPKG